MTVVKKKTGTGGGNKYYCDFCNSDITSTVSLRRPPLT